MANALVSVEQHRMCRSKARLKKPMLAQFDLHGNAQIPKVKSLIVTVLCDAEPRLVARDCGCSSEP